MEGLMEKLPMNKKKATLLKTWKRRFFRAKDGWLHYYEVFVVKISLLFLFPFDHPSLLKNVLEADDLVVAHDWWL